MTNKDDSPPPVTNPKVEVMVQTVSQVPPTFGPSDVGRKFLAELKSWGILDDEDLVLPPSTLRLSAKR